MIYVYLLKTSLSWTNRDEQLMRYISFERREKVKSYNFLCDRKTCLYGNLIVKSKLKEIAGIPISKQKFSYSKLNKPIVKADKEVYFNISHSDVYVCCAISLKSDVGVDIEVIDVAPLETMEYFFHKDEILYVKSDTDPNTSFYKIWTMKEAYGKYYGYGLIDELRFVNLLKNSDKYYLTSTINDNTIITICNKRKDTVRLEKIDEVSIYSSFIEK